MRTNGLQFFKNFKEDFFSMQDKKTERITIRLTQKQKQIIQNKARSLGLTTSSFVLTCALKSRAKKYKKTDVFDKDFLKF